MAVLVVDCGVHLSWTSLLGLQNISKTAVGIAKPQHSPQLTAQSVTRSNTAGYKHICFGHGSTSELSLNLLTVK